MVKFIRWLKRIEVLIGCAILAVIFALIGYYNLEARLTMAVLFVMMGCLIIVSSILIAVISFRTDNQKSDPNGQNSQTNNYIKGISGIK